MSEPISIEERAARYVSKISAVAGSDGHGETYKAACVLAVGFDLGESDVKRLLMDWNVSNAAPVWSEKEIDHKVRQAMKAKSLASGSEIGAKRGTESRTSRTGVRKSQKVGSDVRTSRTLPIKSQNGGKAVSRTLRTTNFYPSHMRERAHNRRGIVDTLSETSETLKSDHSRISGSLGKRADEVKMRTMVEDEIVPMDVPPLGLVRQVDDLMEAYKAEHGGESPTVVTLSADVLPDRETFMGMRIERSTEGVTVR